MADTVAVMNRGRIEQLGAPAVLYELPRTVFVANFLGQSNLFTGNVVGSTSTSITVDVGGTPIVVPTARSHRHSGTVTVGVRPEKLQLAFDAPTATSALNILGPGRVVDVSFSGVSTQYLIAVPGIGTIVLFAQNMVVGPVATEGAEVWVSWQVEHGFGLEDTAEEESRFPADTDTAALATQSEALLAELGEG